MTAPVLTAHGRRSYAIARSRELREHELAPLRSEVDHLVSDVGWDRARPVVETVMAPVRVSGPRGASRSQAGKRAGARLLADLTPLPVQERLDFAAHPTHRLAREMRSP